MFETARLENTSIPDDPVTKEEAKRRAHGIRSLRLCSTKDHPNATVELQHGLQMNTVILKNLVTIALEENTGIAADGNMDWLQIFLDDPALKTRLPDESNFLRYALKKGLKQEAEIGANAFKYGLISSTDTHIAAPGLVMEKNHPGHGGAGISSREGIRAGLPDEIEYNPGGLAVLYSEENTRDSLFAAMRRREAHYNRNTPHSQIFRWLDYKEDCALHQI